LGRGKWPRRLERACPPPLFLRLATPLRSTLSLCGLETEQDIFTIFKLVYSENLTMFPPSLVQIGPRVLKSPLAVLEHPLKRTKNLTLIRSTDLVQIWNID